MSEPTWLALDEIDRLVELVREQFPNHSIEPYPHKRNDLAAGLNRPKDKWWYDGEADLTVLAAEYAFGIGKAHAFADGNKRICFLAAHAFLERNYLRLVEPESGFFADPIIDLMANKITVQRLADLFAEQAEWIEAGDE